MIETATPLCKPEYMESIVNRMYDSNWEEREVVNIVVRTI